MELDVDINNILDRVDGARGLVQDDQAQDYQGTDGAEEQPVSKIEDNEEEEEQNEVDEKDNDNVEPEK